MDIRSKSQIAWVVVAVLVLSVHPGRFARAQFAPVNKARALEKSVIEGDEEVRKVKTGQAEIKSAKPVPVKPVVKPVVAKKVVPKKAQTPEKPVPIKSATVKPKAAKPATAKPMVTDAPVVKRVQTSQNTVVAVAKPAPKKRRQRIRYVKPTPIIVIEAMDRQNLISGISQEGRFVYLRVTPETVFRVGDQTIPATSIVDGMKLDCWGGWEKTAPDVYSAKGVLVKGRLDDYALRIKINEACQKLSRVRSTVAAAAPVEPASAPESTAKPEEKKPDAKKPEEPKPGEPKPGEPKPADPNAPPANPEEPKPGEPAPAEPGNPQ